jgi:hypothetical protein
LSWELVLELSMSCEAVLGLCLSWELVLELSLSCEAVLGL